MNNAIAICPECNRKFSPPKEWSVRTKLAQALIDKNKIYQGTCPSCSRASSSKLFKDAPKDEEKTTVVHKFNLIKDAEIIARLSQDVVEPLVNYKPVLIDPRTKVSKRLQEEGGVSEISTENLKIVCSILGSPACIQVVGDATCLIYFDPPFATPRWECPPVYLATGFTVGYGGTGPNHLTNFIQEHFGQDGLDEEQHREERAAILKHVARVPSGLRGVLVSQIAER